MKHKTLLTFTLFSYSPSRRRGALHDSGHEDDDGVLVAVRSDRHLLLHCKSGRISHHLSHRKLHSVSALHAFISNVTLYVASTL